MVIDTILLKDQTTCTHLQSELVINKLCISKIYINKNPCSCGVTTSGPASKNPYPNHFEIRIWSDLSSSFLPIPIEPIRTYHRSHPSPQLARSPN